MTTSSGALNAPRRRKSMFDVAADSEGANHVTITTRASLRRRISAVRMTCVLCLSHSVEPLCHRCYFDDKFCLAARVRHSVIRVVGRQPKLEAPVLLGHGRVCDQVVSE